MFEVPLGQRGLHPKTRFASHATRYNRHVPSDPEARVRLASPPVRFRSKGWPNTVLDNLYRQLLLSLADAPPVRSLLQRYGMRMGVRRFVAAESLDDALGILESIEKTGKATIFDLLGEFVDTEERADEMTERILRTLDGMADRDVENHMSVKPTQLGLAVDPELAYRNARRVLERARERGSHICFDMENHPYVANTLDLFERVRDDGFHNASTVLQSYLRRTENDLERLLGLSPMPAVRIVKGAYREDEAVAYQDKAVVDERYRHHVYRLLEAGAKANVATHDESIIREVAAYAEGAKLGTDRFEFQLLYGVSPQLQDRLVQQGYPVRIYVPYGEDWYGYFSRRLAERPANLMFVVRGLFG